MLCSMVSVQPFLNTVFKGKEEWDVGISAVRSCFKKVSGCLMQFKWVTNCVNLILELVCRVLSSDMKKKFVWRLNLSVEDVRLYSDTFCLCTFQT